MTAFQQIEMQEARIPQGIVRYRESGTGEPLVFVHGLLTNGLLWRKVVDRLAGDFRCIVPDWPLGSHTIPMNDDADLSPPGQAEVIAEFLETMDLRDVTLVGNDTGGALIQLLIGRRPERIGRVVLTSCDAYEVFPPAMFKPLSAAAKVPGALAGTAKSLGARPLRRLPNAYGWLSHQPVPHEVTDTWVGPARTDKRIRRDTAKFLKAVDKGQTLEAATRFGRFDKPVLLAWAADDKFFAYSLAERMAQAFPQARLEQIEDCRTYVPEDQPARLAELIRAWAREPAAAAA
jgi:pimeloyl-ACP methyl ester carboxylesterase